MVERASELGPIRLLTQQVIGKKNKKITHQKVMRLDLKSLMQSDLRLDAGYFTRDVMVAQITLRDSKLDIVPLEKVSDRIFMPPRTKRALTSNQAKGTPFLMPSEFFNFPLTSSKNVILHEIKNTEEWFVKKDWVLLTRSGLTGIPLYITERFSKFLISDDAIRIIPNPDYPPGYIYCYLSTWTGQTLLTRNQFGVAVEHIQPHQVKTLPIPALPSDMRELFHKFIVITNNMREEAENLLNKAQDQLYNELQLERIPQTTEKKAENFKVSSKSLNLRLDASYHEPTAKRIISTLTARSARRLGDKLAKVTLPTRFKRTYVEKKYGLPFLQGGSIVQVRPLDLKYISQTMTANLNSLIIHKRWVLVTRSGTVGKTSLVSSYWDGWAASEHIFRIIPDESQLRSGYLVAFLQTPYGQEQLLSRIHGGVVDEITATDVEDMLIPIPDEKVQMQIDKLVSKAYEMKEMARIAEEQTISTLDGLLHRAYDLDSKSLSRALEETIEVLLNPDLSLPLTRHGVVGDRISWESVKKEQGLDV